MQIELYLEIYKMTYVEQKLFTIFKIFSKQAYQVQLNANAIIALVWEKSFVIWIWYIYHPLHP